MTQRSIVSKSVAAWATAAAFAFAVPAAEPGLGKIEFPTSGSEEAQKQFEIGVLYLHNFEYEDARDAFRAARDADPDFVMGAWGEAMTHNHPIWQRRQVESARSALERLAPTRAERLAMAPTERERRWLEAVEVLFEEGPKRERDLAYLGAMRRLDEAYPDDHEAAAFHALAILGSSHGGRDFATYMRAAAIAEEIFAENPRHPGALHYMIHSYDDPVHAPLGLRPARIYADIAPDAAHAQHMTSHIFVALGMWEEVVDANRRARDVEDARRTARGDRPGHCGHYASWLEYGLLQQGRHAEAGEMMDACYRQIVEGGTDRGDQWYFSRMRARYLIDTGDWDSPARAMTGALPDSAVARHDHRYASALAAIGEGDVEVARILAAEMERIRDGLEMTVLEISGRSLEGRLALAEAQSAAGEGEPPAEEVEAALEILRDAAAREAEMAFMFGPPAVVKPAHELLGDVLLELGRPAEAIEAYEAALGRAPRRTASLLGVARAAAAAGDSAKAAETRATLRQIWRGADALPAEVREAAAPSEETPESEDSVTRGAS